MISFDLPGHGLTGPCRMMIIQSGDGAFPREIADIMKLDRIVLAGNSMGGAVACNLPCPTQTGHGRWFWYRQAAWRARPMMKRLGRSG